MVFKSTSRMRLMDIRAQLTGRLFNDDVRRLASETEGSDAPAFTASLFRLLTDGDKRVADNAAWVLSHAGRPGRMYLQGRQRELIDAAMSASGETMRRLLLTILLKQQFDAENIRTDFLDFCLSAITDGRQPVAVRALCVYLGYALCRPFVELREELAMTLDVLDGEALKPGLRHARRVVLAKIRNPKRG